MDNVESKKGLNSNALKLIAIIAMTIDHVVDLLFPNYAVNAISVSGHLIGRLTAPIMWFFVCVGFTHTRNHKKYMLRMFLFALISHFAYCFAFGIDFIPFMDGSFFNQTSVMWGLAWSVVVLYIWYKTNLKTYAKFLLLAPILLITFPANWSCISVVAVLFMYDNKDNFNKQFLWLVIWALVYGVISFFAFNKAYGLISLGVVLVYPFLRFYNGERGKMKWMKWFFYTYYPAHLVIIGILRLVMYGNVPLL